MNSKGDPLMDKADSLAFLSFELDLRAGRLLRSGQPIPLRPKTWAVLLYLVEHPGKLISRDELLDAVWPNVAVTPDTLTKSISELRVALRDDSKRPTCIETVHRRGVRFIATTRIAAAKRSAAAPRRTDGLHLVGRESELARMQELFERACDGSRQIVFVTGGAGVGKTSLVESFLQRIEAGSPGVGIGRGASIEQHGVREPYMPVLDAIEGLSRETSRTGFVDVLRRVAPSWLAQMPWLAGGDAEALRALLQAARPEHMLRELAALTEAWSADAPLVLVLEDLHWSDPSTVDLLAFLGERREPARLLVIGTYRPAEAAVSEHILAQAVRSLETRRRAEQIPLHNLTAGDVRDYLELRYPAADFARLAAMVHDYTDGNPLFVVAVVDHLVSRGWILETEPGWALSGALQKGDLEVPDDARRVIQMQFQSLPPSDREWLEVASVAGVEFAPIKIGAVLRRDAAEMETRCEALSRSSGFLRGAASVEWPDGSMARRYRFTHELYRQAAYTQISEGRRRRLHQSIGEALEGIYGERSEEIAATLAVHFERSGDHRRAVRYLAAAAATARQRMAGREAIGYLRAAIAAAKQLPQERERSGRELELRLALSPLLGDLHGFASDQVLENGQRARALCREVGTEALLFQVLYSLGHCHVTRAELAPADEIVNELDALALRLGTPQHRLLADSAVLRGLLSAGDFLGACCRAERLAAAFPVDAAPALEYFGPDPVIAAHCHHALALWMLGEVERSRAVIRGARSAAERVGQPFTLATALFFSSLLKVFRREAEEALRLAESALALTAEHGFIQWNSLALAVRGWARAHQGRAPEGIEDLQRALALFRATGAQTFSTFILAFLAEAHLRAGSFADGLTAIEEGLAIAESTRDRTYWPELWRLKGELLLARWRAADGRRSSKAPAAGEKSFEAAESCFLRALEIARASQAKSLELRAATSLARAWRVASKAEKSSVLLAKVLASFGDRRSDGNRDVAEAVDLLGRVSAPSTSRSRRVAR